jgi:hypothetical protein
MNPHTRSLRTASLIAGLGLALIVVLASLGNFVAVQALITPGDAAKTAQDILNSEALFRLGIACLILAAVLDMIVAVALLVLFEPVSRGVSTMAALFRVAYTAVFLVAITQLVVALGLLGDPTQAMQAVDAYNTIWLVGLIFFGVHLVLIATWHTDPATWRKSSAFCLSSLASDISSTGSAPCSSPITQSTSHSSPSSAKRR